MVGLTPSSAYPPLQGHHEGHVLLRGPAVSCWNLRHLVNLNFKSEWSGFASSLKDKVATVDDSR